ncbi:MAG: metal ABC transporter permease, partial [Burkholderiales bacterium]|nr:metal ABC transporter permease [Burkholderiales bacterium]
MRRSGELSPPPPANLGAAAAGPVSSDWTTLRRLFPYLWQYKWRVLAALAFMVAAKMANVGVPLLLKQLVDTMNPPGGMLAAALLVVPAALLLTYGLLRLSTTLFAELRD